MRRLLLCLTIQAMLSLPTFGADDAYRCLQIDSNEEPTYCISIYRLLAAPRDFDGKLVRVEGYAHFEFEGNGLYPHESDYEARLSRNALWIEVQTAAQRKLSGSYVTIIARFRAGPGGHRGLYSGELHDIVQMY